MVQNFRTSSRLFAAPSPTGSFYPIARFYHGSISSRNQKDLEEELELPEHVDSEMPVEFLLAWYATQPEHLRQQALDELLSRNLDPNELEARAGVCGMTLLYAGQIRDKAEEWSLVLLKKFPEADPDMRRDMLTVAAKCIQARGDTELASELAAQILADGLKYHFKTESSGPVHAVKVLSDARKLPPALQPLLLPIGDLFHLTGETPLALRCYQIYARYHPLDPLIQRKILSIMLIESKYSLTPMIQPPNVIEAALHTEQRFIGDMELKLFTLSAMMDNEAYEDVIAVTEKLELVAEKLLANSVKSGIDLELVAGFFDFYRLNAALKLKDMGIDDALEEYQSTLESHRQMVIGAADLIIAKNFNVIGLLERARFLAKYDRENEVLEAGVLHMNSGSVDLYNLALYAAYAQHEAQDPQMALKLINAVLSHAPGHLDFLETHAAIVERQETAQL